MLPKQDDDSPIESLQQTLDTPNVDVSGSFARQGFHREASEVPPEWAEAPAAAASPSIMSRMSFTQKHHTLAKWIFGVALVFFLAAVGIALYFFTGNRNILSTDKIDIVVTGPSMVAAGEVVPLAIEIRNNNASTLEVVDLLIEYPPGTRSADDVTSELLRTRVGLGNLTPGSRFATTSKAIVFGEEGAQHDIVVSIEYRVAGSNAIFVKKRAFSIEIDDSPVALSVDAPQAINSGDEIELELTVRSNSTVPIENVVMKAEYPFGFEFTSGSPDPAFGEAVWSLGDIEPQGERTITVRGTLEGQNDEERVFRFDIGVEGQGGDVTDIGTSFARAEHTMKIARAFVDLDLRVGGQTGETFSMPTGGGTDVEVAWRNNLSGKLSDVVIELVIDGNGFDESQLDPGTGFYDSSKNKITWDRRTTPALALLDAGGASRVAVGLVALDSSKLAGEVVNPIINLALVLRGTPVADRDTPEQIRTEARGTIRVSTNAGLVATLTHDKGPIEDSGPIPPKSEVKTTYTVMWEASSSVNDVTDARVTAVLPPYVSWEGTVVPADEDVTFDPATGAVEWRIGTLRAGTGYNALERSVAFQIGLTPAITQVGDSPVLVGAASLSGIDGFTGVRVSDTTSQETTRLDDPGSRTSDGVVVD